MKVCVTLLKRLHRIGLASKLYIHRISGEICHYIYIYRDMQLSPSNHKAYSQSHIDIHVIAISSRHTARHSLAKNKQKSRIEEILNQPCTLYGQHYATILAYIKNTKLIATSTLKLTNTSSDGRNIILPFVHIKKNENYKIMFIPILCQLYNIKDLQSHICTIIYFPYI